MLSLYLGNALESRTRGLAMAAVFAVLYGLLYLILSLEDYALLAGALLGFAALTTVMFATLRVELVRRREPRRNARLRRSERRDDAGRHRMTRATIPCRTRQSARRPPSGPAPCCGR